MLTVTCRCKEVYHAGDEHIGKEIQCRKCGRKLKIVAERVKRVKKESRAKARRAERAARVPAGSGQAGAAVAPFPERARIDAKTRKRMMIIGAALAAVAGILGLQVISSLRHAPAQVAPASDDPG